MPGFCSTCGSRTASRRRLTGASVTLRHQLDLMREIAKRQEEDIAQRSMEKKRMDSDLLQLRSAVATAAAGQSAESGSRQELEAQMMAERAQVDRLRREVAVWRSEGHPRLHGGSCAAGGTLLDDAQHDAERRRWEAQKRALENELEDVKARRRRAAGESAAQRDLALSTSLAASRADVAGLQDEIARDRQATSYSWQRCAELSRQVEEERASFAGIERQLKRDGEERAQAERRLEVERELHRAQQVQLKSIEDATEALRAQLQRARRENSDLRASLLQNQASLRQLRH